MKKQSNTTKAAKTLNNKIVHHTYLTGHSYSFSPKELINSKENINVFNDLKTELSSGVIIFDVMTIQCQDYMITISKPGKDVFHVLISSRNTGLISNFYCNGVITSFINPLGIINSDCSPKDVTKMVQLVACYLYFYSISNLDQIGNFTSELTPEISKKIQVNIMEL